MTERTLIRLADAVPEGAFQFGEPVSLTVCEGDTVVVCGPNGSGKTTLANMLRGAQRLRRGARVAVPGVRIEYVTFHDQYPDGCQRIPDEVEPRGNGRKV